MTISSTTNRVAYTGNGATTAFAFGYKFLANADLKVYQAGTLKTITTHYTVSGAGDDAGGTVTFLTAPANGESVVIVRDPAITQATDLVENDPLPAETLENALDKLTIIAQRLDDLISRSFVLADDDTSAASLEIPTPSADKVIKWNSGATALEYATLTSLGVISVPVSTAQGGTGATSAAGALVALGALASDGSIPMTGNLQLAATKGIVFEGTTADDYETTLVGGEPTADRTVTLPDATDTLVGKATTDTLTNKRVTLRKGSTTSSATPTINTDNVDLYQLTAQAADITSFTTNLSGTPTDGQGLIIEITGTAARAITWGASFEASTVALPTTTVSTDKLTVGFLWNSATSKWRCIGKA